MERYGDWAVLNAGSRAVWQARHDIALALTALGARGVYLKLRIGGDLPAAEFGDLAPAEPLLGERAPAPLVVTEHQWRVAVDLADGVSTGLFLDQRENRELVFRLARGQRVLNLFSYTGSFSVAAAAGGAAMTTSVDLSARALRRARENLALNGITAGHQFFREDALRWLPRAARRETQYDFAVLDPPSFARRGKDTFTVTKDYAQTAAATLRLLVPGGRLLAVTNHRGTGPEAFTDMLTEAAELARVQVRAVETLKPALDCALSEPDLTPTKSVLMTLS